MGLLKKLEGGQGYLKAGFLGFQKAGKTFTSAKLACGVKKFFNLPGPIAFFDTESGAGYIREMVEAESGQQLMCVASHSFDDLCITGQECLTEGISVLIVDSVTHIWRELCDAHLKAVNKKKEDFCRNKGYKFTPKQSLEFQDWSHVKKVWNKWTDFYINSKLHIIICGRAGYEYDMQSNEETGKKELVKTGIRMKTEGEFGFEPSLLVEMERDQIPENGSFKMIRRATVIGDRFHIIDGSTCIDPDFEFFKPHIAKLAPTKHTTIDTTVHTDVGPVDSGFDPMTNERRKKDIALEEIENTIKLMHPSQREEDKTAKIKLVEKVFNTKSWKAVECMDLVTLENGLKFLKELQAAGNENK